MNTDKHTCIRIVRRVSPLMPTLLHVSGMSVCYDTISLRIPEIRPILQTAAESFKGRGTHCFFSLFFLEQGALDIQKVVHLLFKRWRWVRGEVYVVDYIENTKYKDGVA